MRINIFFKTFLMMLISFSLVFLFNMYLSYQRFSPLYIEENIQNVKQSIMNSVNDIDRQTSLQDTELIQLSSETAFLRVTDNVLVQSIGPNYLDESEIIDFVIDIFDNEESVIDGNLTYHLELVGDVYHINYIYEFDGGGDYLIIQTRIQSLQNVDTVLSRINMTQSIFMVIAIFIISMMISSNISSPIKKINAYAKNISSLVFNKKINLKRHDEFQDLISSLNEMTFNLQKTYQQLNDANLKLTTDIDLEKEQEEKKKQLIMTINHEIKTPLAVMKGMIEGMIDGVGRYKDKDKYLKALLTQISTIENITQDLTYTLRLEDKRKDGHVTDSSFINEVTDSMNTFASQHQKVIHTNISSGHLIMSEELLNILVTNLVKNAIIYSESRIIKVNGELIGDDYHITVRNKGMINESELDKLFDSFYRIKNKNSSGTGLGLFIVKQISELYGYPYKIFNDNGEVVAKVQIKNLK